MKNRSGGCVVSIVAACILVQPREVPAQEAAAFHPAAVESAEERTIAAASERRLEAVAVSSSLVMLSWSTVEGADGYRVLRRTGVRGPWCTLVAPPAAQTTHEDTTVHASSTYLYVVQLFDESAAPSPAPVAMVTTPPALSHAGERGPAAAGDARTSSRAAYQERGEVCVGLEPDPFRYDHAAGQPVTSGASRLPYAVIVLPDWMRRLEDGLADDYYLFHPGPFDLAHPTMR
ncbi:hypothetical protein BH23GEM2_BH23GEM2_20350 [soil metagenome]